MAMLLVILLYVVFVWVLIWGYFGILYVIDILERMRDNRKSKRN